MKGKGILIGFALVIVGVAAGGGGYALGRAQTETTKNTEQQSAAAKPDGGKNLYNGDELTLVEMYDSLQSTTGKDFDHRMLVYLLTIHNIESGMLRMAESKAEHQQLKDLAKLQMGQNDKVLPLLNEWQSNWGFSHH